jgi:hypothetical protein
VKTISPLQYEWLCAVERGDYLLADQLSDSLPYGELFERGLYTYSPVPDPSYREVIPGSWRLTTAGRDAILCHRVITGSISIV